MFQKFIHLTATFEGDHPGTHIFGLPYLYSLQGWTWNATGEAFNKQVQVLQDTREDTRDRTYRTWVFLGIGEQITCIAWEYRPAIGNGNKAWQRKEKEDHIECAQRGIWNRHVELIAYMTFSCQSAIVEILATCSQLPTARLGSNREQLKELARSWTFRHSAPESFTASRGRRSMYWSQPQNCAGDSTLKAGLPSALFAGQGWLIQVGRLAADMAQNHTKTLLVYDLSRFFSCHFLFLLGHLVWGQTHLDSLTFNLLNQTKTLSAALICYLMLGTTRVRARVDGKISLCSIPRPLVAVQLGYPVPSQHLLNVL